MRFALSPIGFCIAVVATACGPAQKSARGFHLPDGDPVRGQAVFVELKCHSCHTVVGVGLPPPVVDPASSVTLGGLSTRVRTDGGLVTSIIDPSHTLAAGHTPRPVASGRFSGMGDFTEAMTVRELIDLVAFLQSRYEVVPPDVEFP